MQEINKTSLAQETHAKAIGYYKQSEQFGYKFLMEVKKMRDDRLFEQLGFHNFDEYSRQAFGYSRNTMNERIQSAEAFGEDYNRALGSYGKQKARQLAQLPEDQREKVMEGGIDTDQGHKSVDEATTRELEEYKRKLKQSEEANKTLDGLLSEKADTISALEQQVKNKPKPEVVEKTVTKEVKPSDYDELKREAEIAGDLRKRNEFIEKQYQNLLDQRQQINQDASKMQELEEQINNLHGQLNEKQKHELAYKRTSEFIKKANQMLDQISPLVYAYDYEDLDDQSQAYVELRKLITRVEKWANDLSKVIGDKQIIEGDFINE